jgi:phosphohistidine phosphatase SixA
MHQLLGRKEAVTLGVYLNKRGIKFDNVFASSAERAKQTAILACQYTHSFSDDTNPFRQDLFDPSKIVITEDIIEIHR